MIRLLKENNFDIMEFQPFLDYINYLETQGYEQTNESSKYGWIEENYQNEEYNLKILSFKDEEKEWVTVNKYKNNIKIEQVEFVTFTETYCLQSKNHDYNRLIEYSAHFEDEEFTRMVCSAFWYKDNNYLSGWRELRKFDVIDLGKVLYSPQMNLKELTSMADDEITEFYEVISLKEDEVKELKLNY